MQQDWHLVGIPEKTEFREWRSSFCCLHSRGKKKPTAERIPGIWGGVTWINNVWFFDSLEPWDLWPRIFQNKQEKINVTVFIKMWTAGFWILQKAQGFVASTGTSLCWMSMVQALRMGAKIAGVFPQSRVRVSLESEGSLDQKTPFPWRGDRSDTCKEIEKPKMCCWNYLKL